MDKILVKYSQLGKIFDLLSLGVLILSPDRRIVTMNGSAEMLTGYREADLAGKFCYVYFKDYLCNGRCKYLESGLENRETLVTNVEIFDENRGERSLTKIESPLYDARDRLVGCIEIFQDRTTFEKLINRIRFEDIKLKLILDNLDLGVFTVDRSNHISFYNKMAETITGFSRDEVLGKPCGMIFKPDWVAGMLKKQKSAPDEIIKYRLEAEVGTANGQPIPAGCHFMSMKNEDGRFVGGLITFNDLTLRHQFDRAVKERYTFYDMVGKDPAMQRLFEIIPVIAASYATVLINGDTGTGKDLLAHIIHNASPRADKPFVKVNCASLPDNLLESEMFGYKKGAFTGAEKNKTGRFEEADGGTIFLDEIGDLPLSLQAKLLRVLEDKEFYPLGSEHTTRVNVRIISATNQNLEHLVRQKRFREDLFFRIKVLQIEIPPLKDRKMDLPLLIYHILKRLSVDNDMPTPEVSKEAMEILLNHSYPGNVRELENILEHCLILCQGEAIEKRHFPVSVLKSIDRDSIRDRCSQIEEDIEDEKEMIISTLHKFNSNKTKTAKALNMDRTTLWRKMKKFKIEDTAE
jgi:PAS domain S-box-containing protein